MFRILNKIYICTQISEHFVLRYFIIIGLSFSKRAVEFTCLKSVCAHGWITLAPWKSRTRVITFLWLIKVIIYIWIQGSSTCSENQLFMFVHSYWKAWDSNITSNTLQASTKIYSWLFQDLQKCPNSLNLFIGAWILLFSSVQTTSLHSFQVSFGEMCGSCCRSFCYALFPIKFFHLHITINYGELSLDRKLN